MKQADAFELAAKTFFYGTFNEPFALKAAADAVLEQSEESLLVGIHSRLCVYLKRSKTLRSERRGQFQLESSFQFECWRQFWKGASQEHMLSLLYKWISGFSDQDICTVLGLSQGTLLSYYNRGLLDLGSYLIREVAPFE